MSFILILEESEWDPNDPSAASTLPIPRNVTPAEREFLLIAKDYLEYVVSDVLRVRTCVYTELGKRLRFLFDIRTRRYSFELAQIIWLGQPRMFRRYWTVKTKNKVREMAYNHVIRRLDRMYGPEYTDQYINSVRRMICKGAGSERYEIYPAPGSWFSDHDWTAVFGDSNNADHSDESLSEFISEVKLVTPDIIKGGPRFPISAKHELALDLFYKARVEGYEFCVEMASIMWGQISREKRAYYRRVAKHRCKVEFCLLAEQRLRPLYKARGVNELPRWRPSCYPILRENM